MGDGRIPAADAASIPTERAEGHVVVGYTAGPWEAERGAGRGSWIKGSSGEWAALACGDTDARAEANARLIAAAPDLLEALVPLAGLEIPSRSVGNAGAYSILHSSIRAARAAIAKATAAAETSSVGTEPQSGGVHP